MWKCCLLAFVVLLSWSGGEVAMLQHVRPMAVQCSRLATLAGRNPYEKTAVGWKQVIKSNYPCVYKKLVQRDGSFRTKEDATAYETSKLKPKERAFLRKLEKAAVAAPKATRVDAKRHGLNLSKDVAKHLESRVQMKRGTLKERNGLKAAEAAEKAESRRLQAGAQLLTLQSDALAGFAGMQDLLDALHKQRALVAEALLKSDLDAATAELPQKQRRKARAMAKTMSAASKKLGKVAAKKAAPFLAGNTKLYSAEVAPGLLLRGKIDAQRLTCDGERSAIDIFEHKARQRRLFKEVKEYEKIQCLSYIDLVKRDSADAGVRCFLVETFQGNTWQCEVKEEPDLWKEQIVGPVGKRANELQDLIRPDTPSEVFREWLDAL